MRSRSNRAKRSKANIVAVTGSVGKTGTKEMLRTILSASGAAHASEKSYNNLWGVPLSLARMPKDTGYGVFEMGMNHSQEKSRLSFASSGQHRDHNLGGPGPFRVLQVGGRDCGRESRDLRRFRCKAEQPFSRPTMSILQGSRHMHVQKTHAWCPFGQSADADARLVDYKAVEDGSAVTADILGTRLTFMIRTRGRHLALNAIAALAAAKLAGRLSEKAANPSPGSRRPKAGGAVRPSTRPRVRSLLSTNPTTPIRHRCARRSKSSARCREQSLAAASRF